MIERGAEPGTAEGPAAPSLRVLMIVPTLNERLNLPVLVEKMAVHAPEVHILVVDDASPDGTADAAEELRARFPLLSVLRREGPRGLGRAQIAGIRHALRAGYDVVGTMDADLSHEPAHLPGMLLMLDAHDVVVGSRYVAGGGIVNWRLHRRLLSWTANRFASALLGLPAHDMTSGYRLYRASFLAQLDLEQTKSSGYSFLVELLDRVSRLGARVGEHPIVFVDRTAGASKLGRKEVFLGVVNLVRLRLTRRRARRGAKS